MGNQVTTGRVAETRTYHLTFTYYMFMQHVLHAAFFAYVTTLLILPTHDSNVTGGYLF